MAVTLASFPVPNVKVFIIVVAFAKAFSKAFAPRPVVLVVRTLLLVSAVEYSLAVAFVIEDFPFVEITIEVRYLGYLVSHLWSLVIVAY